MDNFIALESIQIANPCSADWNKMQGDERARFCHSCEKNVYNLSDMTRAAAENLVREKEGNICVRFYRRADGTVLTDNCPIGLQRVRRVSRRAGRIVLQPMRWSLAKIAMLGAPLFLVGATVAAKKVGEAPANNSCSSVASRLRQIATVRYVFDLVSPRQQEMGAIAMPMPAPTPAPAPTSAPDSY